MYIGGSSEERTRTHTPISLIVTCNCMYISEKMAKKQVGAPLGLAPPPFLEILDPHWNKPLCTYLSQALSVHDAIIQSDSIKTRSTVPGHMVISVFSTKRVLKLILLRAPMDREDASVNSLLCSNITLHIR